MKLLFYKSPYTEPQTNLAIEEYLCESVKRDEVILYLWRNAYTVVIGRNQNAWRECRVEELRNDGGTVVRRLSGGGAMFQDMGNVNFTFLANEDNYDVDKQTQVLIEAAAGFGISVEKTGRNDLTANGRKVSGNAYYQIGKNRCHHGTILVDTDLDLMDKYLHTPGGKMSGKGVASVKSRVVNLTELGGVDPSGMEAAMLTAFEKVYGSESSVILEEYLDEGEINKRRRRYESDDWTLVRLADFSWEAEKRFDWGMIHIRLGIAENIIKTAEIFSDALDADCIQAAGHALAGKAFTAASMARAVEGAGVYADDIRGFIMETVKN
jgi:lipoate-protein ligase A